jgi:hypothetical protein
MDNRLDCTDPSVEAAFQCGHIAIPKFLAPQQ